MAGGLRSRLCGMLLAAALPLGAPARAADPVPGPAALAAGLDAGRAALKERGVEIGLTSIGETVGALRGGLRRGAVYEGRLDVQLDADLETLMGWQGLRFHANAYQIHGTGPTRYRVGSLAPVSGIEALPATRLHELWLEQSFLDRTLSLRAGNLAADAEFLVSPSATLFANGTFGWPVIAAANLPSGGPAAPLATPGLRVRWEAAPKASLMLGLFNGDPAHARGNRLALDPQRRNPDGTDFSLHGSPFLIVEAAKSYSLGGPGPERTGVVKVGFFHHFGAFDDVRIDRDGVPLAAPWSSGLPARRRGDDGLYALIDQTIFREDEASDRGAALFARVAASPSPASLVSLYADAGLVYKGLLPGRPDDVAGLGLAHTRIARRARLSDWDRALFSGMPLPVRRSETAVELTYQAVVAPGFTVQPSLHYIAAPGGGVRNPLRPDRARIRDSVVLGLRATVQY
ncbi:porin [Methylobacterium sp. BE186]|uniref:carbohydrate porin n=1 Tax=Methylobacterium sp. BE186 TaxID=2817715 RepID=UPI00285490B0|nr:carbohydrate porin [Methylobacterium sp. BE186]MDR7038564.1 porin [Methylobacterium sp. BE186]